MKKKSKQMKQWFDTNMEVAAFAIFGIIVLEAIALCKGINGIMFGSAMTALGAIVGWVCKTYHKNK